MTARTQGFDDLALPDLERRQANAIRFGTVSAVDLAGARCKVRSGNIETAWLPWLAGRASGAKRRWDPPEVGEQVAVISPGGDLAQGLVLPGVYQSNAAAPSASADKDRTVYGDGTSVEYDRALRRLRVDFGGTSINATPSAITLTVGGVSLAVSASGVAISGGSVTHNGTNIGDTHTHGGVAPGPGNTGAPN